MDKDYLLLKRASASRMPGLQPAGLSEAKRSCRDRVAAQSGHRLSRRNDVRLRESRLRSAWFRRIPLYPFLPAQNPGCEHVGQALRFCLSDLVIMKDLPARTRTASLLKLHNSSLIRSQHISSPKHVSASSAFIDWSSAQASSVVQQSPSPPMP
jgi:hypothetical protein